VTLECYSFRMQCHEQDAYLSKHICLAHVYIEKQTKSKAVEFKNTFCVYSSFSSDVKVFQSHTIALYDFYRIS